MAFHPTSLAELETLSVGPSRAASILLKPEAKKITDSEPARVEVPFCGSPAQAAERMRRRCLVLPRTSTPFRSRGTADGQIWNRRRAGQAVVVGASPFPQCCRVARVLARSLPSRQALRYGLSLLSLRRWRQRASLRFGALGNCRLSSRRRQSQSLPGSCGSRPGLPEPRGAIPCTRRSICPALSPAAGTRGG
jgi:hypothetical protein